MRKIGIYIVLSALACMLPCSASWAKDELAYLVKDNSPVKVFVAGFVNESGQNQILPEEFKVSFENTLLNRKSVSFMVVNNINESDVRISGIIKKYLYSKTDPITTYASPSGLLLDAVTTENYCEMNVEFTVTDTRAAKVVWKKEVSTFIKRTMTPDESIPLIYDKVSRNFLWKSFGKPK